MAQMLRHGAALRRMIVTGGRVSRRRNAKAQAGTVRRPPPRHLVALWEGRGLRSPPDPNAVAAAMRVAGWAPEVAA